MRAYPEKLRILSAFGPTKESQVDTHKPIVMVWVKRKTLGLFRLQDWFHLCIVTLKVFKIFNSQENPPIWVCISLHQKHSKSSTSQDTLSFGYASRYTKSTRNPQLLRIPSHLGIHIVTPKALKILIILWCMYAFEFRYRHPGYYDITHYKRL